MLKKRPEIIKIGETYFRINLDFNEINKLLIKDIYYKQIGTISKELVSGKSQDRIKISIEFEEGSLKTRIAIWGAITGIYMGIANYGSFRTGIRELVHDIHNFSELVSDRISHDPNLNTSNILRIENRTGIPGRINELYNKIDKLDHEFNNLTPNQQRLEIDLLKQEIAVVCFFLNDFDRHQFLYELPAPFSNNLPHPNERKINYLVSRYGLKPDEILEYLEE